MTIDVMKELSDLHKKDGQADGLVPMYVYDGRQLQEVGHVHQDCLPAFKEEAQYFEQTDTNGIIFSSH